MKILKTIFTDAYIIGTDKIKDNRGAFARLFCQNELIGINFNRQIRQINYSMTKTKGSIRGMHYQNPPFTEDKLIRCLKGMVFDVIIDIRKRSPSFLKWHGEILSEENMKMIYVPKGFAHGFQSLDNNVEMLYLHTEFYNPQSESGIRYDEKQVNIKWPIAVNEISDKDKMYPPLSLEFEGVSL